MARVRGSINKNHKDTKQCRVYEEYINTEKSIKEISEKFGIKYTTCQKMLYRERALRGTVVPRKRR